MERVHRFDRRQERCDRIAPTLLASGVGAERACAWPLGRLLPTPRGRTEPTRMERDDEEWGQLATKIPKELQQRAQTALRENRRVDTGLRDAGASGEARPRRAARSRARVEPAASDARDAGTEKQGCYQGLPGLQAPQTSHRLRTAGGFCRLLVPRLPGELFPPMACRKPRSLQAATRLLSRAPRTPPRLQLRVPTPPTRGHAGAEAEGEARAFTVERRGGSPRRRRQCPRFSV